MSSANDSELMDSVIRTSQIIAAALITGVVVMLGVTLVIDPFGDARRRAAVVAGAQAPAADPVPPPATSPMDAGEMITWMAVAFAAVSLPLSFVVPGRIADRSRASIVAGTWKPPVQPRGSAPVVPSPFSLEVLQTDIGKLALLYQTQWIVGAALIEGTTFFSVIAYMIGGNPIALALAILLLAAMFARFPTRLRVASWIDRQQELLIQDRQSAF